MTGLIILDSAPLGFFCNPKNRDNYKKLSNFVKSLNFSIGVPEIIDYELRRNLELENLQKSISLLSQFQQRRQLISLESEDLIRAAELWAWCRKQGSTTTENKGIDIDVILVSQALSRKDFFNKVVILTIDTGDLSVFCDLGLHLWDWKNALTECNRGEVTFL
jgi:toxin FitB